MRSRPIRLRRVRRTDFEALTGLLAAAELAVRADDRALRSRFRRLVADLGADLYLASIDDAVCGVVHVTYARHLLAAPQAMLELLVVHPQRRRLGVGRALANAAIARARRRGCQQLATRRSAEGARPFFTALGWHTGGERVQFDLPPAAD
ncbi:MAG: GNAT family N-acetyltransferase [Deltaproteobacteria bacterium]|nr:GNAT family N-acetyltransferase [Deltaproteobacteria bacterium]